MSDVNYYLKKPVKGKSLIFLQFKYHGNVLKFSFKQTIEPINWNKKKQRLKANSSLTSDGKHLVNDLLDELANVVKRAYNAEIKNGIPTPDFLKQRLRDFLNQNILAEEMKSSLPTFWEVIDQFIKGEICYMGRQKSPNSLQNYRSAKLHLLEFSKREKYTITFDTITLSMFYSLVAFLRKKGLAHNTIAKTIAVLKTFMNHSNECGFTTNTAHKSKRFSMPEIETEAVYLNTDELIKLYQFDFSYNKRLEQVRDLFIVGALTGLRFSDFSRIQRENFITMDDDLYLKMITAKTSQVVILPVNEVILKIMEKYSSQKNNLPPTISNQKFNAYIKEVCRIAGMNETGRLSKSPQTPTWAAVSSHTCRRSMCTNLYLSGMGTYSIMAISGHRTERSFLKYIKVSQIESAKKLQSHLKISAGKFFLKAVS